MIMWLITAGFAAAALVSFAQDTRRLRNGVFALLAAGCAILALGQSALGGALFLLLLLAAVLAIPVLAGFLISNGVVMLRKEGRGPATLLSLLTGFVIIAAPVAAIWAIVAPSSERNVPTWVIGTVICALLLLGYVAFVFAAFLLYCFLYSRTTPRKQPRYLVVLGSGLIGGRVSPLLAGRLDKAVELYRAAPEGSRPLIIPSGGQGADEDRPEGVAMAEYLREAGVPSKDVVAEPRARTTMENLILSRALMDDPLAPTVVVTSSYHVFRAAMFTRRAGMHAQLAGSKTAGYFVPSAFLREFVAVFMQYRWVNLGVCAAITTGIAAITINAYSGL